MTVTATTARIAELLELVPSPSNPNNMLIRKAFSEIPRVVQDANLPAAIVFPGEAQHSITNMGRMVLETTRNYRVVVLIQDAQLGTTTQGQVVTTPFLDAIPIYFIARPGFPDPSNPQDVVGETTLGSDGGYALTEYPLGSGKLYHSVEIPLQVKSITSITYYG